MISHFSSAILQHFSAPRQQDGHFQDARVFTSADWLQRSKPLHRPPARFAGARQADIRYATCRGDAGTVLHRVPSDVAFAVDEAEALWLMQFDAASGSRQWCADVNLFDSQLLFGRRLPGDSMDSPSRSDGDWRRERHARCQTGHFISSHEVCH